MDYAPFVQKHRETGADITVAALPMDAARAEAFGVMKVRRPGSRGLEFMFMVSSWIPYMLTEAVQLAHSMPHRLHHANWHQLHGPSSMADVYACGVLLPQIDDSGRIVDFAEKPKGDALRAMEVDTTVLGLDAERYVL
jgi:ADP-glucose pyrophosphorylase